MRFTGNVVAILIFVACCRSGQIDIDAFSLKSDAININKRGCNTVNAWKLQGNRRSVNIYALPGDRSEGNSQRPPIIPFEEFAREDIIILPKKTEDPKREKQQQPKEVKPNANGRAPINRGVDSQPPVWIDPDPRPTGYNTPDDDNEDEMEELRLLDGYEEVVPDNAFSRWFKDTYIGSPYDSRKKKQARYVIRNITFFSFAIGAVFTIIWYVFPGKFINYRGETDFTARYSQPYVDPSNLLDNDYDVYKNYNQEFGEIGQSSDSPSVGSNGEFIDNAEGLPTNEQTRFAPTPKAPARAPGRTADL